MREPSRSPAALSWHLRLEARVLLGVTLVVGVSLVAMLFATRRVVTQYSLQRSGDDLASARIAFNRLVENRAQFGARQARLITELPIFRSILSDPKARTDAPTINGMAQDYCGKLEADFCVVTDPAGAWIGEARYAGRQPAPALTAAIADARHGRPVTDFVTLSDGLFLIVAEPALFGEQEVLGTFTAGYRLDDSVARELSVVAHCDVGFVCANGDLCGTSLPLHPQAALKAMLRAGTVPIGPVDATPAVHALGGTSFVGGVYPLVVTHAQAAGGWRPGATGSGARLVLLQDWTPTERAMSEIYTALLWVGLGTFGIALGGGLLFSRRMTRPLRDLADAADDISTGNWSRRVPIEGPAEARTMAEAFNRMTVTLSHWHREATSQAEQVREAYGRFSAVTNSANDAIVSVNRRGEIVFWNQRAHSVFGYEEQEALGQPLTLLMPERYRLDYAEEMARLMLGESRWLGSSVELAGVRRDGSEVPVELSLSTWKSGQEVFFTAVIRDITERKTAAEALKQREDQLRQFQKMEAVGRLAGGIAHDFNNLLTAILGYADLLLHDLPADQPSRQDAEEIQKAGRSAASLIRELLAFSRKQVLQPVVLDLNSVVSGTENLLRRLLGEHIDLVLKLQPNLDSVRADRGQLEQVLVNLAVNARDAMPNGGRLTVQTAIGDLDGIVTEPGLPRVAGRHAVLTVSDSGSGMSAETRSRIFEPFFTTKAVGKGTGLGLATVYGIVKQSGGHIWVESESGRGATFKVALPIIDAAVPDERDSERDPAIAPGSELVLLVEDNDSVRALARETLVRGGYRVIEARNGEEALRVGASHLQHISLLLTDVVMPIMGGRELADQLTSWRPGLKVIFTSGYIDDADTRQSTMTTGAFLQKPFTPAVLGRAVRDALDARQDVA